MLLVHLASYTASNVVKLTTKMYLEKTLMPTMKVISVVKLAHVHSYNYSKLS